MIKIKIAIKIIITIMLLSFDLIRKMQVQISLQ